MSVRWISAVWSHSPYRGEHLLLHLALADFANDEGTCFPSVPTLARKARCSVQWARRCMRTMIADGTLEIVEQGLGRGNVNRYRLLSLTEKGETEIRVTEIRETESREKGNSATDLSYIQNRHEPSLSESAESDFEQFWAAYPRKVSKAAARKAFVRVMSKSGAPSLADLLAAVARYASSVTELRFVAHPTTWLNGERWHDETGATHAPRSIVRVSEQILSAQSMGAAFAMTGRSKDDLLEIMSRKSDEERAAALEAFTLRNERRA